MQWIGGSSKGWRAVHLSLDKMNTTGFKSEILYIYIYIHIDIFRAANFLAQELLVCRKSASFVFAFSFGGSTLGGK